MGAMRLPVFTLLSRQPGTPAVISFNRCAPGTLPPGWTIAKNHSGAPPLGEIVPYSPSHQDGCSLAQVSRGPAAGRFPPAIWNGQSTSDGEVSVTFKAVAESVDRAAGIVRRYQHPINYYALIVLLNRERLFEAEDQTFLKPRQTGLWPRPIVSRISAISLFRGSEIKL